MGYFAYLIGAVIVFVWSMIVQANLKSKMQKGAQMRAGSGKTANQVVEEMLRAHDVTGITVEHKPGNLTDCYSPKEGKIYLSDTTYGQSSVTAIAVAAHEAGASQVVNVAGTGLGFRRGFHFGNRSSILFHVLKLVQLFLGFEAEGLHSHIQLVKLFQFDG